MNSREWQTPGEAIAQRAKIIVAHVASPPSCFFSFRLDDLNALHLIAAGDAIDYVHAVCDLTEYGVAAIEVRLW